MITRFTESEAESAAMTWRASLGFAILDGLELALGEPFAVLRDILLPNLMPAGLPVPDAEGILGRWS